MEFIANEKAKALEKISKKKEYIKLTKLKRKSQEKLDKVVAKELKDLLRASKKTFKNW
jgi:hypothetical protein